VQTDYALINSM